MPKLIIRSDAFDIQDNAEPWTDFVANSPLIGFSYFSFLPNAIEESRVVRRVLIFTRDDTRLIERESIAQHAAGCRETPSPLVRSTKKKSANGNLLLPSSRPSRSSSSNFTSCQYIRLSSYKSIDNEIEGILCNK